MSASEEPLKIPVEVQSADPAEELRERLRELVPEAFEGNALNPARLAELVGERGEQDPKDRYVFSWSGQTNAIRAARQPSTTSLRFDQAASEDPGNTEHVYIEADNLEALKLLAEAYTGRVKCIYIDPPYNTGFDRIYRDDFSDTLENYLHQTGQKNGDGAHMLANPETDGRYHSAWLSMMFPRLWWAKKLLAEDGVILVSIDDDEVHHLRLLMDLIFRQENHIANFVYAKKKKGSHLSKSHRSITEYVVAYAKDKSNVTDLYGEKAYEGKAQPLLNRSNKEGTLDLEAGIVTTTLETGQYMAGHRGNGGLSVDFSAFSVEDGIVTTPLTIKGRFRWTQGKLDREVDLGSQVTLSKQFGFNVFRHDEASKFKRPSTMLNADAGVGTNEDATAECNELLGEGVAEYPKPVSLIKYLVRAVTYFHPEALVMDFFAGSGTTGHAVWEVNAELAGTRKFVLVQLPEKIDPTTNAANAGFKSLGEFPPTRLKAAKPKVAGTDLDLGFRHFRMHQSSVRAAELAPIGDAQDASATIDQLEANVVDPLIEGWDAEQVAWQVLLADGYPLHSTVVVERLGSNEIRRVTAPSGWDRRPLLVCLDDTVNDDTVDKVTASAADIEAFLCRDVALTDAQAANLSLKTTLKTI